MLRIATWNMSFWSSKSDFRQKAWSYLEHQDKVDIALLQESNCMYSGKPFIGRDSGILDERKNPPKNLGWGSAIVSYGPTITKVESAKSPFSTLPVSLMRTFPGSVAIGKLAIAEPIFLISAYGVIDGGYADTTVHKILSDITPLIDEQKGKRIIFAGDLNITTQWSDKHKSFLKGFQKDCLKRDQHLFERFKMLGLKNVVVNSDHKPLNGCDCCYGEHCRHVQTQRHNRSKFPWQNDYIFLSEDLSLLPYSVQVVDDEGIWQLSSHCPIIIEFPSIT